MSRRFNFFLFSNKKNLSKCLVDLIAVFFLFSPRGFTHLTSDGIVAYAFVSLFPLPDLSAISFKLAPTYNFQNCRFFSESFIIF